MSVRKTAHCEFCFRKFLTTEENTVCGPCDLKMEKAWDREMRLASKMHKEKYKCTICNKGLSLARRINCVDCVLPGEELSIKRLEHLNRESEMDSDEVHHLALEKMNKSLNQDISFKEFYVEPSKRYRREYA